MMDMTKTIEPKSDQLNADDLVAGPITITITEMRGADDPQQPISVHYRDDNGRPYKPCKSMRRVMVHAWGKDGHQYVGKSMTLYCDPHVKFGGQEVGGIRISHMSHVEGDFTVKLTATRAVRKPYHVKKLDMGVDPGEEPASREELIAHAEVAAEGGMSALERHWNTGMTKPERQTIADQLDRLKSLAKAADDDVEDDPSRLMAGG